MVSVGHLTRAIEAAGVPTVAIYPRAFRVVVERMRPPRVLLNRRLMGRPVGRPADAAGQRATLEAALRMLVEAREPGSVVEAST